jgi:hypothetical protein
MAVMSLVANDDYDGDQESLDNPQRRTQPQSTEKCCRPS